MTRIRTHEQNKAPPPPPTNGNGGNHADDSGNGDDSGGRLLTPLPENRRAVVEYGLATFQQLAHERDELDRLVASLKIEIAAHKVENEAMRSRLADMESRVQTAVLMRDQAVGERATYEALFTSFRAQLAAFNIPAAPLVREAEPKDE